ncbi:MAG: hypothetical protein Q8L23_17095 [Caulobacter sp.]|nr:hypothetical protein [Caulobacter sp.]
MALALNPMEDRDAGRERFSRLLAVAGALYTLIALIVAGVAALGLLGLFGQPVDPAAVEPALMLGLPWSLAVGAAAGQAPTVILALACAAMAANGALLAIAARLVRVSARG